jgi:hypothetical protein
VAVLNAAAWWLTEIDDEGPLPDSLDRARGDGPGQAGG